MPNLLGLSKQYTASYRAGFIVYAVVAFAILIMLRTVSKRWMETWIGEGGRALRANVVMDSIAAD